MPTLEEFANSQITGLKAKYQYRKLDIYQRLPDHYILHNGKKLLSFACNDYLGLSYSSFVKERGQELCNKYANSSSASRFITGNSILYQILEETLSIFHNTEACTVFGSGYLTNIGVIPSTMNKDDLIIGDKLIHACLLDGVKLSGAKFLRFNHNDLSHCEDLLKSYRKKYRNCLMITEDVFSMDGDLAPLPALLDLAKNHNSWLLSDSAHLFNKSSLNIDLRVGTLSKALGSYGGYVCGSKAIIEYINNTARSLIFSTALPPVILANAIAALEFINNNPEILLEPLAKAKYFTNLTDLKPAQSQIVPMIIGDSKQALIFADQLAEAGFLVKAIRPPTVPPNTARLRFTFSALHKNCDILKLAETILNIRKISPKALNK